jgi:alpha-L-rhamnosidase
MKKYVEFMRSETTSDGLILMQKRKSRCLGDWATPCESPLPTEFVNTCLFVDCLLKLSEIATLLGEKDEWLSIAESYKTAVEKAYFDPKTGDYCGNEQASNAFALAIGLGDERTKTNLVERYRALKKFDTGIFGTKLLVETLLKLGEGDVAYALWDSDDEGSFKAWKNQGESTLWESWKNARSHNHPMFGAFVKCFFEWILGIRRTERGYKKVRIQPLRFEKISKAKGVMRTESGEIAVSFARGEKGTEYSIRLPEGVEGTFAFAGVEYALVCGENRIVIA